MHKIILFISLSAALSTVSWAQNIIRPGLWEVTTKSDLLALVPHIPSEQMRQLTKLARQYGLEIPQIRNGAATSNVCITPEMAKQEVPAYLYENQSGCTVKNASRTGNRYQMELICDNPQFKGNGYAQGVFMTPESLSGWTEFDSIVQGAPLSAKADTQGRWIGERCEVVKPLR